MAMVIIYLNSLSYKEIIMGLDCYVLQSKLSPKELEEYKEKEVEANGYWDSTEVTQELWYGRKTHSLMDWLLTNYYGDDNCEHILIDHITVEGLKKFFVEETILPNHLNTSSYEYEMECLQELINNLEAKQDTDQYLYFYAWY